MAPQAQANLKGSMRLGSYLKRLRSGYGYSLRRVEERARAEGGEIDNSQLSRYEKGICYPSFDKLRVLANIFNVSIQSFSDVVDLEAYEDLKPVDGEPAEMLREGTSALRDGDTGRAFAHYERALELLGESDDPEATELIGTARVNQAIALTRLGKLALAEQELRQALRSAERLSVELRLSAVLTLANIHAEQGERFLSELEAQRAYELARAESNDAMAAHALSSLGLVLAEQGRYEAAVERNREAVRLFEEQGIHHEAVRIRINIAACYVELGKSREGVRMLRECLQEARNGGHRRLEALAWCRLGRAYYRQEDRRRARSCLREADALASVNEEKHLDILFFNTYYEWRLASEEDNPTRARIAFGRLKALRSAMERRIPEVEAFDAYVERGRSHA